MSIESGLIIWWLIDLESYSRGRSKGIWGVNALILTPPPFQSFSLNFTVGVNIKFPYRLKKNVVLQRTNVFKNVTVYRCYGVYTLTIFTCHFSSNSAQNTTKTILIDIEIFFVIGRKLRPTLCLPI